MNILILFAVLRVAVMSDLQGYPYPEDAGMRNLERALDIFEPLKPDMVITAGDINDGGYDVEAVKYYKQRCDIRLGKIPHVACLGNHELDFIPAEMKAIRTSDRCRADFNAVFGAAADKIVSRTIGGYDFISLAFGSSRGYMADEIDALRLAIERAVKRDPAKPIFVITHYHPYDTVADSSSAGNDGGLRKLLNNYPQVISLSGHTHNPLSDPRSIWQGEFTAVDTSTLCYGCIANRPPAVNQISCLLPFGHESVWCMLMEIEDSCVVFRRFSVRDGREVEEPWRVDLPYNPQQAKYSHKLRKSVEIAPQFGCDVEPTIWYDYGYVYLLFNAAKDVVNGYNIELINSEGTQSYFHQSDFYRAAEKRANRIAFRFPPNSLKGGVAYQCKISPIGFFGRQGESCSFTFTTKRKYPYRDDKINALPE